MPADAPTPSAEAEGQSEMLPCPFCGGRPWAHENDWSEPSSWSVQCACRTVSKEALSRQEAIAAWNRRASAWPPTGDGGLREAHGADAAEALAFVQIGMEFAYRQGLHEIGYDPVRVLRAALSAPPSQAQPGGGDTPLALIAQGWEAIESDGRRITIKSPPDAEGATEERVVDTAAALAPPPPEGVLREALERIAAATPANTNSGSAERMSSWVHAVARTALSALPREAKADALTAEERAHVELHREYAAMSAVNERAYGREPYAGVSLLGIVDRLAALPPREAPRPDRAGAGAGVREALEAAQAVVRRLDFGLHSPWVRPIDNSHDPSTNLPDDLAEPLTRLDVALSALEAEG